ncbi:tyrosine-type recombinase/integrase [Blastococcus saxobsidens]|uniref:Site-specific recombinase XerD n=2 Tax=Blastococcus saxobsidens TaxID=138336 RepID=A0A4Q7Y332_9ACTN|nr:tyrosine-type recombinase/integrase [Blastococcus saxobsidens]RZU30481.1 site-specific recombinase XerD [Blastococcus saxobsidens]
MTARPLPEEWRQPIAAWEQQLRADGFTDGTVYDRIRAVRRAAHAFAGCPWQVTSEGLTGYADEQPWSAQTRGTWLRNVRLFYEFAVTKGWTDRTPTPDRYAALVRQPQATIWAVELAAWAGWLAASGQSPNTVKLRTYVLRRLACAHPEWGPWELGADDLAGWLGGLGVGPAALRVARQSLRAFYRWGAATGRVRVDPSAELPAVRHPRALPRPVPDTVIVSALEEADERQRDAIELGAVAGLRRSEIARARTDDLTRRPDGWWLRVVGKGGQARDVPLPDELGDRLASRPAGWLFPNGKGGHLTAAYLGRLMRGRLAEHWTPHTLRHRFASTAYAAQRDYRAVQELLGHANVNTTMIYTAVPEGARRAAVTAAAIIG